MNLWLPKGILVATMLALGGLVVGNWWCTAQAEQPAPRKKGAPDVNKVAEFMRNKLTHAQDSLKGLCTENFDLVGRSAKEMIAMSEATEWVVIGGQRYAHYSQEFRTACEQLSKAAGEKDLDAAQLAWIRVNMECFDCHEYVRQVRIAQRPSTVPQSIRVQ